MSTSFFFGGRMEASLPFYGPIALLIDGQNSSPELIGEMLGEISKYGSIIIRRVFGDWTNGQMVGWRQKLEEYALSPEMAGAHPAGKNAADIKLTIDAMDIMNKGVVKGFCLVSSDSDFTSLATKMRGEGFFVIGIGEQKTPSCLRSACDKFILTDNLRQFRTYPGGKEASVGSSKPSSSNLGTVTMDPRPAIEALPLILRAFDSLVNESGRVHLSHLMETLRRLDSSFDPRTYGKKKLIDLIAELSNHLTLIKQSNGTVYVRLKKGPDSAK